MFTTMHEDKHDRVDSHASHHAYVDIHVDRDHDDWGHFHPSRVSSAAQRRDTQLEARGLTQLWPDPPSHAHALEPIHEISKTRHQATGKRLSGGSAKLSRTLLLRWGRLLGAFGAAGHQHGAMSPSPPSAGGESTLLTVDRSGCSASSADDE